MFESWIGHRVKVKLKTEGEAGYWVLGRLRDVTDEGIKLSLQLYPGSSWRSARAKRPKSYPWDSILDIQLLDDR